MDGARSPYEAFASPLCQITGIVVYICKTERKRRRQTMKRLISVFMSMTKVLSKVSGAMLMCNCVIMCVHVVLRAVFNSGVPGVYEIVQYTMLTIVSLSLAENELGGGNIVVTVVLDKMKPRAANILSISMYVFMISFMMYILNNQIRMTVRRYYSGALSPVLSIPHWIMMIIICVGLLFFIIACITKLYNMIVGHKALQNEKLSIDQIAAEAVIKSEF